MIQGIRDKFQIKELRERVYYTLFFVLIYRLISFIPLPGIDPGQLSDLQSQTSSGILGLLNAFTGGAFSQASVMALGIMPYISASIAVQLFTVVSPYFQKMQKEGESGRNKINQITRWLTLLVIFVQSPAYITNLYTTLPPEAFTTSPSFFWFSSFVMLTSFTIFAMWLGEKITSKGISNGISLLIMIGIIARFPTSIAQEFTSKVSGGASGGVIFFFFEILIWLLVVGACILLVQAVRKIPVQYVKASGGRSDRGKIHSKARYANTYIPLKLNASGVMPIIFAQAIMFLPVTFMSSDASSFFAKAFADINGFWYNFTFALMIILFTYVYTAIAVPTNRMSDDMKKSGAFIPGIRPGNETASFVDAIMSRITLPGSFFLAVIAITPALAFHLGVKQSFALFYGGTSLLILVGVVIEIVSQVDSYSANTTYASLSRKSRFKNE